MKNRADESSPWNSLLAASSQEYDQLHQQGAHATGPHDVRTAEFSTQHANPAARRDLGRVAAQSLGETGRVPASELAARQDPTMASDGISREYLHQQSHGGGGTDTFGNLGIGSAAANTELIPIEAAVNGRADLRMRVVFRFRPGTLLLERVDLTVLRAADGHPIYEHAIAGQNRVYTREQYEGLQRLVGFATNVATLQQLTQLNLTSVWEVALVEWMAQNQHDRSQAQGPGSGPAPGSGSGGSQGSAMELD